MKEYKQKEYTLEELKKDLERLDKKANALEEIKMEFEEIADIVAPVYLAKRFELLAKYFGVKVKVNEDAHS